MSDNGWTRTGDALPKVGRRVLLLSESGEYYAGFLIPGEYETPRWGCMGALHFPVEDDITYWRELPEPPGDFQG